METLKFTQSHLDGFISDPFWLGTEGNSENCVAVSVQILMDTYGPKHTHAPKHKVNSGNNNTTFVCFAVLL